MEYFCFFVSLLNPGLGVFLRNIKKAETSAFLLSVSLLLLGFVEREQNKKKLVWVQILLEL